jgi:protein involved in sex pheromone biosynthesis
MKKLIVIVFLGLVLGLSGCVSWAHPESSNNRDRRNDQQQDRHYNEHAND